MSMLSIESLCPKILPKTPIHFPSKISHILTHESALPLTKKLSKERRHVMLPVCPLKTCNNFPDFASNNFIIPASPATANKMEESL
ncbi:hypothetical protein EHP00_1179 [Ecytonucleospora hepatopenaei]|uniref:Uncharacterized protein n=1 Tax=Ecytonucleospora hepatopenaei TaxID=646526 RepID=A0A1W0E8E5_9MICR|nr:hypothetical protein EHP00_1179 [Ecytonucleospora hepatopenaei]